MDAETHHVIHHVVLLGHTLKHLIDWRETDIVINGTVWGKAKGRNKGMLSLLKVSVFAR